ncbi:uncharacterized protein LOC128669630 [Plodia interpunctella]|uniref:uncharacterized protein LOC128669630 n=1 Tax=Plodia interpunctella TaxID=58824 RepID=UPI0023683A3A|nr:uncharacterized protein LOC128669630 [Plodia interpunctella]
MDETPDDVTETTETTNADDLKEADPEKVGEAEKVGEEGVRGEEVGGEHLEGEHLEGEHVEGEHVEGEELEGEHAEKKKGEILGEGEELLGEEVEGEGEETPEKQEEKVEEVVEEEEVYVEEPPPDPTAPFNFSDSKEALKEPFQLRPDQLAEVEQLWDLYQAYTPSYTDIDNYITEKELLYMLKCLMLMTVTEEQFYELIEYCVRPPHPKGHITFDQFVKMVTIRQRDFPVEDELRSALQVFDPDKTGLVDRENLREVLLKQGHKIPQKLVDSLIKEVDMSNDGTLGIEDIVGTMCIDLNKEDLMMLMASLNPDQNEPPPEDEDV